MSTLWVSELGCLKKSGELPCIGAVEGRVSGYGCSLCGGKPGPPLLRAIRAELALWTEMVPDAAPSAASGLAEVDLTVGRPTDLRPASAGHFSVRRFSLGPVAAHLLIVRLRFANKSARGGLCAEVADSSLDGGMPDPPRVRWCIQRNRPPRWSHAAGGRHPAGDRRLRTSALKASITSANVGILTKLEGSGRI